MEVVGLHMDERDPLVICENDRIFFDRIRSNTHLPCMSELIVLRWMVVFLGSIAHAVL